MSKIWEVMWKKKEKIESDKRCFAKRGWVGRQFWTSNESGADGYGEEWETGNFREKIDYDV